MRPVQTFSVIPSLPSEIEVLRPLAYNLRWAWSYETRELFRRLDRELWETSGHNPVVMLGLIPQEKLAAAARDEAFLAHARRAATNLNTYLGEKYTWFSKACRDCVEPPLIAYFSAEFGLTECLSIFAGGLGMLAGDHLKSASDLGLPLVGVGLLYQQGYFRQYLNQSGWQQEAHETNDFANLPLSPVRRSGRPVTIEVLYAGRKVFAQIWQARVGRISLYLLDTNIAANAIPEDRNITDQLYGGNKETRLKQEILLGIGGYRALEALDLAPSVFHMNEGHSSFLALERVRRLMETRRLSFAEARELASAGLIFTTHTPVEAGHDFFSTELMDRYFGDYARELGISREEFLSLGRTADGQGDFCMTVLALRLASRSNAVSRLHGEVSRRMWQVLWPGVPLAEVPIGHVTNGVHFRSWISPELNQLYDRYLGPNWREEPANHDVWGRVQSIPAEELWRTHERRRERLVAWARQRVRQQRIRRGASQAEIAAASEILDPEALTIGFARRFATYKRATLILRDLPRLQRILNNSERPVQIIFAGKAHPQDDAGKELIRQIKAAVHSNEMGRRVAFLVDYDMVVARYLVQGVDVWLNTPLRPNEASGTSGMKAAANGVLNISTLDGWWDEVWNDPDNPRGIGWAIGNGETYNDHNYQDQVEADALYELIERDVVPAFYDRGADSLPLKWIERMKDSIASICPFVNTHRMVSDYTAKYYFKTHDQVRKLEAEEASKAKALAGWTELVRREWPAVGVESVSSEAQGTLSVGSKVHVNAIVKLGALTPRDVKVELYLGRVGSDGGILDGAVIDMETSASNASNNYEFTTKAPCNQTGILGYTVRIRPYHQDLSTEFVPGLIYWADALADQKQAAQATTA
ncbi:MAG TPA: alpha-glucan family phosphorylase [Terriglobales bacterium]